MGLVVSWEGFSRVVGLAYGEDVAMSRIGCIEPTTMNLGLVTVV